MTCIVGIIDKENKKVIMGGDSASVIPKSSFRRHITSEKIFKVNGFLFGCCGSFRAMQLLQHKLSFAVPDKILDPQEYIIIYIIPEIRALFKNYGVLEENDGGADHGEVFFIAYEDKLFRVDVDFQVMEYRDGYDAIGSGSRFALGSLHTTEGTAYFRKEIKERVTRALEAAEHFNGGVVKPFYIHST